MGRVGGRGENDTVERGSALVGILVSLLIVVGLAGASLAVLSARSDSDQGRPAPSARASMPDLASRAVEAADLAQVQTAADAYGALNGTIPPDPEALVSGGLLESLPRCTLVIDPSTGVVGYGTTQVDPACHP